MRDTDDPDPHRSALAGRYDAFWDASAPAVRAGHVAFDAWVMRKAEDPRRGVTLLARPAPDVADALAAFCDDLRVLEPEQYYQPRADLHLTVLSLFTATPDYASYLAHVDAYEAAIAEALAGCDPFAVDAVGVTLSSGAVLVQGFPRDRTLGEVRDRLRAALTARGLGEALDGRYRLETAHATLMRFTSPLRDPARFVDALARARGRPFGTSVVADLELTLGDWYQSTERSRLLATYTLPVRTV